MDSNDLNRRIRYALSLSDKDVDHLLSLVSYKTGGSGDITGWRLKPGEPGYVQCQPSALYAMLDGLIAERRGQRDSSQPQSGEPVISPNKPEDRAAVDNNRVLKQLRIALSLRTENVQTLINKGGGNLGSAEVNALFRKPGARNFRRCGDQVLRWFLAGLNDQRKPQVP